MKGRRTSEDANTDLTIALALALIDLDLGLL